jgi:hypothetical protein
MRYFEPYLFAMPDGFYATRRATKCDDNRQYIEVAAPADRQMRRLGTTPGFYRLKEGVIVASGSHSYFNVGGTYRYRLTQKTMEEVSARGELKELSAPNHNILLRYSYHADGCQLFTSWLTNNRPGVLAIIRQSETSANVTYLSLGEGNIVDAEVSWDGLTGAAILEHDDPKQHTFVQFDL